jgi:hypothetical protein
MNSAKARGYYVCLEYSEYIVHRRGCEKIKKSSIFLGTLYTDHQAKMTANKRFKSVNYCYHCIGTFPT